jgi:acyl-CoA synthetase (AMP-forming)/AMP-acid ligase II
VKTGEVGEIWLKSGMVMKGYWNKPDATADAIRKIAAAIQQPGGEQAVQLKVAEKAVDAYGQLAKTNNTMIVPGHMGEVAGLIGTAMQLFKGGKATP